MSSRSKACIVLGAIATYSAVSPHTYPLIPAILPAALPGDYHHSRLADTWPCIALPLGLTGAFFQLWLNGQSRSFAGGYGVAPLLLLALRLARLVEYVPGVVGTYDARPRVVAHEVADLVVTCGRLRQALVYPGVEQGAVLEDEE